MLGYSRTRKVAVFKQASYQAVNTSNAASCRREMVCSPWLVDSGCPKVLELQLSGYCSRSWCIICTAAAESPIQQKTASSLGTAFPTFVLKTVLTDLGKLISSTAQRIRLWLRCLSTSCIGLVRARCARQNASRRPQNDAQDPAQDQRIPYEYLHLA